MYRIPIKKITVKNLLSGLLDFFYPVGTIYETTSSDLDTVEKVNAHFGGTWEFYGAGRVLVAKSSDVEFDTIGKTGGEKTHTLTTAEMPSHSHQKASAWGTAAYYSAYDYVWQYTSEIKVSGLDLRTGNTGGGNAHNNLQPYITVYRYRRIS